MFENHQKYRISIFQFWHFSPICDLSGNTVWSQASGFQKLSKLTIFGTFNELLSNENENDVLTMLNDFFCDFQTPWQRCFFGQDMLERWVNPRHLLSSFDCRENSSTTYLFSPILSEQWNKPHVVSRFSSCQTARGSSLMGGGLPLPRNLPLRHKLQGGKNAITTRFRLLFSGH